MRVWVDPEKCQGHTLCALAAPDAFELSEDDGHSTALFDVVPEEQVAAVRKAAANCPERAVVLTD